jgi:hypothetical protein
MSLPSQPASQLISFNIIDAAVSARRPKYRSPWHMPMMPTEAFEGVVRITELGRCHVRVLMYFIQCMEGVSPQRSPNQARDLPLPPSLMGIDRSSYYVATRSCSASRSEARAPTVVEGGNQMVPSKSSRRIFRYRNRAPRSCNTVPWEIHI